SGLIQVADSCRNALFFRPDGLTLHTGRVLSAVRRSVWSFSQRNREPPGSAGPEEKEEGFYEDAPTNPWVVIAVAYGLARMRVPSLASVPVPAAVRCYSPAGHRGPGHGGLMPVTPGQADGRAAVPPGRGAVGRPA